MFSRSFHPVMILITTMLMLLGLLSGCVSDPVGSPPITTPNPVEQINDTAVIEIGSDSESPSINVSGYTVTIEGVPLVGTWVAIADNATQELIAESTSDQTGAFTIAFNSETGDYTALASYENADVVLIAIQSFTVNDSDQDYQLNLNLIEVPIIDENSTGGAVPPPSGGCYMVYTRERMCSWHVWYAYTYYASGWACFVLGGGYSWTPVGSC